MTDGNIRTFPKARQVKRPSAKKTQIDLTAGKNLQKIKSLKKGVDERGCANRPSQDFWTSTFINV